MDPDIIIKHAYGGVKQIKRGQNSTYQWMQSVHFHSTLRSFESQPELIREKCTLWSTGRYFFPPAGHKDSKKSEKGVQNKQLAHLSLLKNLAFKLISSGHLEK
jgi:hypothetical protein